MKIEHTTFNLFDFYCLCFGLLLNCHPTKNTRPTNRTFSVDVQSIWFNS